MLTHRNAKLKAEQTWIEINKVTKTCETTGRWANHVFNQNTEACNKFGKLNHIIQSWLEANIIHKDIYRELCFSASSSIIEFNQSKEIIKSVISHLQGSLQQTFTQLYVRSNIVQSVKIYSTIYKSYLNLHPDISLSF